MGTGSVCAQYDGQATVTINVSEYFDYQCVHDFRKAYTDRLEANADFVVDLSLTRYIDSCALGMLLSLDKAVRKRCRQLRVINCSEHVKKIFSIVHFDKKLRIE